MFGCKLVTPISKHVTSDLKVKVKQGHSFVCNQKDFFRFFVLVQRTFYPWVYIPIYLESTTRVVFVLFSWVFCFENGILFDPAVLYIKLLDFVDFASQAALHS